MKIAITCAVIGVLCGGSSPKTLAQTLSFSPATQPLLDSVRVDVWVTGKVKVKSARVGVVEQPVEVTGKLQYEQWLNRRSSKNLCRSLRNYHLVDTQINIGGGEIRGDLRSDRRLIVDQLQGDNHTVYSPQGPLTRDELDLINVQLSPTTLHLLLPSEPVTTDSSWTLNDAHLRVLLVLDAVSENDVQGRVTAMTQQRATLHYQGRVVGGSNGVLTEIDLVIEGQYDLQRRRFLSVSLSMTEKRAIGHAQPGLDITARIQMQLEPVSSLSTISETVINNWNQPLRDGADRILFQPTGVGVDLLGGRNWYVLVDQPELFMMRQVDRGELIAQCSLMRFPKPTSGEMMSLERFQQQIQSSLAERFIQFGDAEEKKLTAGGRLFRVIALGVVNEIPFQWIYYHVTDVQATQSAFVFTIANDKIEQFAAQDLELIESMQFRPDRLQQTIPALNTAITESRKR